MKTKLLTITLILITNIIAFAQKVENVVFIPDENKVMISYILSGTTEITLFDIELWVAPKCSNDFTKIPDKELKGDFGKNISAGTKYIKWYPTTEINYTNCCFKVKASYIENAINDDNIELSVNTFINENLDTIVYDKFVEGDYLEKFNFDSESHQDLNLNLTTITVISDSIGINQLELSIDIKFYPKWFPRNYYLEITPFITSVETSEYLQLQTTTIQGENIKDNCPVISYSEGGTLNTKHIITTNPIIDCVETIEYSKKENHYQVVLLFSFKKEGVYQNYSTIQVGFCRQEKIK